MTNLLTLKPGALAEYQEWLKAIKQKIHATRMKVALAANGELIALYYEIGAQIVDRESRAQWGSGFIDAFSHDLRVAFPDVGGFSSKNLRYCRAFFRFYCDSAIWQQAVAKLGDTPWAGAEGRRCQPWWRTCARACALGRVGAGDGRCCVTARVTARVASCGQVGITPGCKSDALAS